MKSSYTSAFRAEAVKLVLEQQLSVPQAAKQLLFWSNKLRRLDKRQYVNYRGVYESKKN